MRRGQWTVTVGVCMWGVCVLRICLLIESAASQIVCYDHVRDGVEHELNVGRVRCARHMTVDLLGRRLVLGFKLSLNVSCGFAILLGTWPTMQN